MAQELEDLLIKVESDVGDLSGIDSAIGALKDLAQFSSNATKGADSLNKMASALSQLSDFGNSKISSTKIVKDIDKLKGSLESLANFSKDASKSIKQLSSLGKALNSFTDIGKNLAGINEVTKGIEKMVDVLDKLSRVEKDSTKGISGLKSLGTALHAFNGLDDNVKSLNDVSVGLLNLAKATEAFKGVKPSSFDFIKDIGVALRNLSDIMEGRDWVNIGHATNGISSLVKVLNEAKNVNTKVIGEIANEMGKFSNTSVISSGYKVSQAIDLLATSITKLSTNSDKVEDTLGRLTSAFSVAERGFYDIRSSIEAISTDFGDSLKPIENSDLFDTLKKFKQLNDSYKYVGGLGQGLGVLISSLTVLNGRSLQTYGLSQLLDYLKRIANDKTVEEAVTKLEKLGGLTDPIARLVNALKYTDFDEENNVLTALGRQIVNFYKVLPNNFDKFSHVFNAIKSLIQLSSDAKAFGVEIPEDNVISQLGRSLEGFKGLGDLKDLGRFVESVGSLIGQLSASSKALKGASQDVRDSYWNDAIDVTPIKKVAEALKSLKDLSANLASFKTFRDTLMGFMRFNSKSLDGLDVKLEGIIRTMEKIPEGRGDTLKGLASAIRALTKLQEIDPAQLNLIADGLTKILTALGGIQGNNNKITIRLDSSGVANFKQVVESTQRTWDDFESHLKTDLKNIDIASMFNMNAPLNELQKSLREAERMLQQRLRIMQDEYAKMQNTVRTNANFKDSNIFRTQFGKYATARREAEQLRDVIKQLNVAMASSTSFGNDREAYQHIRKLRDEYAHLEEVAKRITKNGELTVDPASRNGRTLQVIQDRMEKINEEIQRSFSLLEKMEETEEGIAFRANEIADAWSRVADEAERASQANRDAVNEGFGKFGSMLKGSKNGILGSVGNLFDMFGKGVKDGIFNFSEGTTEKLTAMAGVLGKVATAVSMVGGVVGVVVAVFKAWWDTMEKLKAMLVKFIQGCIQFAKTMRSVVVGAFNAVAGAVSKVASIVRSGAEIVVSALRKIRDFGSGVISLFGKLGNAVAPAIKGIKAVMSAVTPKFIKTLASSNFQLSKLIKNTHLLKNAVKGVQRYFSMLTRMLMRKSITKFLNAMKQAFEDMVMFERNSNDAMLQLNYNVSIVFSEFRRLANQVMAIFEPLMNAMAVPAQSFLATIQAMAENMAKFMAILTGQPYYLRAKRFYEDYGANLDETAKKAKNLTNGLDELNILNDKKDETSGISPEDMFEKVPVEPFDFGLPSLAEIIDDLVNFLRDIDWEAVWAKIREFVDRIMEYLNYILSRLDLAEWLGKTLANLVNSIFVFLEELGEKFDPHALAEWLSTFIINALNNVDWDRIHNVIETWATKMAEFWNDIFANEALWDSIVNFITNALNEITHYFEAWASTFDFAQMAQQLTDSVAEILTNYDWEQLRQAVEAWVGGLVDFINTTIANKEFWKALGQTIKNLINNVLIEGLTNLANINLVDFSNSLKVAIQNAIDGIKWDDFASSLSTIATNLANAISDFFGDEQFLTKVTTAIAKFANAIIGAISDFITTLKGYDIGKAVATALGNGLGAIEWDKIFKLPADAINLLSDALRGLLDSIPADFNLGTWLTSHLKITLDSIKWDEIEKNLIDLAKQISNFINGVLSDEEFWTKFGQATGKVIRIGLDFIFEIFNVNGEDLGTAIVNYINGLIDQVNIGKYISKTVDVFVNLVVAIDTVLRGVDWGEIGDQIAQGIVDAVNTLWSNRKLIRQTIEDAFGVFSTLMNKILVKMVANGSFKKIGETIGEVLLGVITGVVDFFDQNLDVILEAMEQLAKSLAQFLRSHRKEIIQKLNKIIDAIVAILDEFLDEKSGLWNELTEIVKKLNLGKLIGSLIGALITKIAEAFEMNSAIFESLASHFGSFLFEIGKAIGRLIKNKINELFKGIMFTLFSGSVGGGLIWNLLSKIIFGDKESGEKESLLTKVKNAWDGFWANMPWNKNKQKAQVEVDIEPVVDDDSADSWGDLFDDTKKVPIELEDPKLGTITAELIEAETIKVVDIFADKLHVGEIDSDMSGKKDMDKFYGANDTNVNGGTLSKDKGDLYVENIFAELLDVKKILSELLEVGEKITTPLLEVIEKITTPLIEAKKITTKLLDAKKIITKLLEADKMWTKLIEVRDKIITEELEVEKKTTTKILEVGTIALKNNTLGGLAFDAQNLEKLVITIIEALKIVAQEIDTETMSLQTLKVIIFTAQGLNVDLINAQTLILGQIIADTLRVGNIVGNMSGGGGYTGYSDWGFGDYYIEKPQFDKGGRWSDESGLAPSAEDFLAGFDDVYKSISDGIQDSFYSTVGSVTSPINLGSYTVDANQGTIRVTDSKRFNGSGSSTQVGDMDIPAEAQYIKDYLTKAIGNEKGALGLMGNLYAESGLRSNNLQDTNGEIGVTQKDIDYTNSINNGANFLDNKGYGLAQWTTSDRKKKLQESLGGSSIDDLDGQLAYLVDELKTDFPNVFKQLQNATSIHDASTAVLTGFEKPKDQGQNQDALRWHYGETLGKTLNETEIPDEPVPTADTPQDKEPNLYDGFDEANVIDISDNGGSGGTGAFPFSFLDLLPVQTEFIMAEVYNVIDKWLGRIYRLFKSFKVDEFLKDLLELDEIEVNLKGKLDIFDDIKDLLDKIIGLLENLIKDGVKCVCGGEDKGDRINIDLFDSTEKLLNKIIKLLEKLLKEGINCNCTCDCGNGGGNGNGNGLYEPIVRAMHDCGFPADDTHLRNNTDAKSKNTRAVESLNGTMGRMADCCQNNYAMTERMVGAIGDWIRCAGDTGHLDNNTKAKSDNTRAVEDLNRNMGGFISSLQGALSNISCNCNCGGNCGNCAVGQGGGNGGGGYTPPSSGGSYTPPSGSGTGGGGYTPPSNTNTGNGGGKPTNGTTTNGGGYNPPDYYDGNGGGQPNGGVLDRNNGNNGNNNNNDNNNNGNNGNNNDNGGNNGGGNDTQQKVDPNTGIPSDYAPTFNPATGLTMFADREGNYHPEYGARKVKHFGDDPEAEWATGYFEAEFIREQEERKKAEEAQKKREEEAKKKNEEAREKNNELIPAVKPYVTDENGIRTFTSDKYKELFDSENKKVEEMRKKGKEYLDNVNKYGTEDEKKSAELYYNELMTNKGSTSTHPYEFNLEKLEDLSAKAVTANALGSDIKEARLGANGNVFAIKDLIKSDAGKAVLANALISNRDAQGQEIYWFKKGNGTANTAWAQDRIDDPEVISTIKDGIKKLGVTEDMANFGKKNQSLYDLYKTVLNSSADDETKKEARLAFQKALAWTYNSSTPARADEYINKLKKLAGVEEEVSYDPNKKTTWGLINNKETFTENFKKAVDEGKKIGLSYGESSSTLPFKDTEQLKKIFEGLRKTSWMGYADKSGAMITTEAKDMTASDVKSLFDYWYENRFLVKGYQMGGIPNAGELFVARENGTPEFVGSFGGRTAVANNDQIVTAVANGVSMANDRMVNAIQSQTESLTNAIDRKNLDVQIGDRQIAEANNRGQKGLGNKFVE